MVIAVILSLLLPGLGHAYMNRLGRALIWFGTTLALSMGLAIAAFAALDVVLVSRSETRSRRTL